MNSRRTVIKIMVTASGSRALRYKPEKEPRSTAGIIIEATL